MRQLALTLTAVSMLAGCVPSSVRSVAVSPAFPTPIAEPLNVAPTVPVSLYHDPANADQMDGVTWDGAARAATGAKRGVVPNPTGTFYAAFRDRAIYDRSGTLVDSNPFEEFNRIWHVGRRQPPPLPVRWCTTRHAGARGGR